MIPLARWVLVALSLGLCAASTGCSSRTTTVQTHERIEESEPQMVSPGEEVVE